MNITDMVRLNTAQASSGLGAASSEQAQQTRTSEAVTQALNKANDRLNQKIESTNVRLSAYGQIKSSVAELQRSSQKAVEQRDSENQLEAKQAAEALVAAFNQAREAMDKAAAGGTTSSSAPTSDVRAQQAANALSRSLDRNTTNALSAIGINVGQNGRLTIDPQQLSQALASDLQSTTNTLASAGQQLEQTATRVLDGNSGVSRSVAALTSEARNLETRRDEQQTLIENQQRASEQATARLNAISASGIAAYQKVFSL